MSSHNVRDGTLASRTALQSVPLDQNQPGPVMRPVGRSVDWSRSVDDQLEEEAVLQISGTGHWFLEGWIGDHSVYFLVDSGSAVTAVSCSFYKALVKAGAPVGALRPMPRKLIFWDAHLAWSRSWDSGQNSLFWCVIRALMLSLEQILWDRYYHTHWISSMYCCLRRETCPFSCIAETLHCPDTCLPWDIVRFRRILKTWAW